jgi:hypothetical protein
MKKLLNFIKKVLSLWYKNLRAETPIVAKYLRNVLITISSTCAALSTGYVSLPGEIKATVPNKVLLIIALGAGLGIILSQSFKKKET